MAVKIVESEVRRMADGGMTVTEIAVAIGVTYKRAFKFVTTHKIKRNRAKYKRKVMLVEPTHEEIDKQCAEIRETWKLNQSSTHADTFIKQVYPAGRGGR